MANKYTYTNEKRDPQIQWYKTNSGAKRWRVKFSQVHEGQNIAIERQGFKSFDEARKFKADSITNIERNVVTNTKQYTVEEYWDIYLKQKTDTGKWRSTTRNGAIVYFKSHLLPRWGKFKLNQVSRIAFQSWIIEHAKENNLSKRTAASIRNHMSALLQDAVVNDLLSKNPIQRIEVTGHDGYDLSLTREQYDTLIHYAFNSQNLDPIERAVIVLALHGLRRGEIIGMKLKYVKSDSVGVFGQVNAYGEYGAPKTRSSERWVPLMKNALDVILEAIAYSRAIYLNRDKVMTDDDFILVNSMAKIYYSPLVTTLFQRISKELGFRVTTHMLRHAFSTFAFSLPGANPRDISNVLGHTKIDMSMYYNLGTDDGKRNVINLFDKDIVNGN
ncbi:tyrosine-type recombinase/integrase [Weissella confusa]|uniref:tyrosine-type recombinase/integrase n=1 Tax=Weissella confusa TaxID=1583 RepID=UPI0018F20679|nr:site-specific integrase [Weissella confusa]MBJ7680607.1 tyrosine-type recombinase/integrase [Weissella confusa]